MSCHWRRESESQASPRAIIGSVMGQAAAGRHVTANTVLPLPFASPDSYAGRALASVISAPCTCGQLSALLVLFS